MLADRHVGSKRGMPIHRLLNEDAVALVIASILTRPALSTNDSRPLFIRASRSRLFSSLSPRFIRTRSLGQVQCAEWSASGTLVSLRLSEENLAHRTSLMHAAVKPRVVSAIMSQGEVLKN